MFSFSRKYQFIITDETPAQVLKLLYDEDVVSEEALLQWADEKEHASEDERAFLAKAAQLIQWLREADSESDAEGSSSSSDGEQE